jgi:GGDEF domain-containing protein
MVIIEADKLLLSIFRITRAEPTGARDRRGRMPPVTPRRRRARPVADAPVDSLLLTSAELAKGWLLALLEQAPLEEAPGILAVDLSRDGPRICEAALRAIVSDTDLRRLQAGGALRPLAARVGELAGATTPVGASQAVDALQAVIWSALRDELRHPDPDMVSEVSERLTLIGELLRGAALEMPEPAIAAAGVAGVPRSADSVAPAPAADAGDRPAVWPADARGAPASVADPLWVGALEDEIRQSAGSPLSLLLAELEDGDEVRAVQTPAAAGDTFSRFAGAVRSAVRRQDILVCESDTRTWIIARDTARGGARALGERIADAVRESGTWHGVPLEASVGIALLGEDGGTSAELIDAAEEARFAAAARGVRVLRDDAGPGDAEPPSG